MFERRTARPEVRAPGFLKLLATFLRRAASPGAFRRPACHRRDSIILDACVALRRSDPDAAYELLCRYERVLTCDPAYLNLLGILFELRHDTKTARRFYGLAVCVDRAYAPAQQNLRRIYELETFGRTEQAACLGDVELRAARSLPPPCPPDQRAPSLPRRAAFPAP